MKSSERFSVVCWCASVQWRPHLEVWCDPACCCVETRRVRFKNVLQSNTAQWEPRHTAFSWVCKMRKIGSRVVASTIDAVDEQIVETRKKVNYYKMGFMKLTFCVTLAYDFGTLTSSCDCSISGRRRCQVGRSTLWKAWALDFAMFVVPKLFPSYSLLLCGPV